MLGLFKNSVNAENQCIGVSFMNENTNRDYLLNVIAELKENANPQNKKTSNHSNQKPTYKFI